MKLRGGEGGASVNCECVFIFVVYRSWYGYGRHGSGLARRVRGKREGETNR